MNPKPTDIMDWEAGIWGFLGFLIGIVVMILIITLFWIATPWSSISREIRTDLLITGAGAVGTLILATATAVSVLQNSRTVKEMEKEREKPLVEDELNNVIQPAINAIEGNIETMDRGLIDWHYIQGTGIFGGGRLSSTVEIEDPAAALRLQQSDPELWDRLNEHDEMVREIADIADEISDGLEDRVEEYLSRNEIGIADEVREDLDVFLSAILKNLDEFGNSSRFFGFWKEHGSSLNELMTDEERNRMVRKEEQYREFCEELLEEIQMRKVMLQTRYGISSEGLPVGEPPAWRGS